MAESKTARNAYTNTSPDPSEDDLEFTLDNAKHGVIPESDFESYTPRDGSAFNTPPESPEISGRATKKCGCFSRCWAKLWAQKSTSNERKPILDEDDEDLNKRRYTSL